MILDADGGKAKEDRDFCKPERRHIHSVKGATETLRNDSWPSVLPTSSIENNRLQGTIPSLMDFGNKRKSMGIFAQLYSDENG
jgi:hypothetical protein